MRLSIKLAGAVGLASTLLVMVVSIFALWRDLELVEQDLIRDARLLASGLADIVAVVETEPQRERLLASVTQDEPGLDVAWLSGIHDAVVEVGDTKVRAVAPVQGGGAVEVTESLEPRDRLLRRSLVTFAATAAAVTTLSLLAGLWLGRALVGRRVDALIAMARRVAYGDFSHPAHLAGEDELTELASELNAMAGQLERARRQSQRDTEAKVQAEIQLRHADRLRTVGQLAAGIAHELGTPLNVIAGRAALLQRALAKTGEPDHDAAIIREQTRRITSIVQRLMDYSRQTLPKRAHIDLASIVEDAVALVRPLAHKQQAEVVLDARPAPCFADPEQLRQVITNLVVNAMHAVGQGGRIEVCVHGTPTHAVLRVDDDGPGMPDEVLARAFEPFFTTKDVGEGTGLGLAVVEAIVAEHDGELTVARSTLGGAGFLVRIPRESP